MRDFAKDHPNIKLNEFIEETVNVKRMIPKEVNGRIEMEVKDVPTKQRTMYIDAPERKIKCKDGEHSWYLKDNRRYIYACKKCGYHKKIYPVTHKFENGCIVHKITGERI
jgi:hypothetical protein